MKCILMVRVSTERQSYDAQIKELFEVARNSGYSEDDITPVSEKESGIKLDEEERAGLNRMKELIGTGEYDCVFAWEISRIARRKKILFSVLEYLVERKIQLIIKEPYIHLLKDDGTIDEGAETIFTLYAQLAESEMRNKIARFKRAKEEGLAKGKYQGGRVTLGYKVNEDGYWEIDEEGAALIRLIFELYLTGEYSATSLAKELLSRGYFYRKYPYSKSGGQLSVTEVKNRIWQILKNTMYLGGPSKMECGGKIRINRNNYPRIIDDATWEACVKKRQANRCISKSKTPNLLAKIIRCKCGSAYYCSTFDGSYMCRVKHNGVEKGLQHSPDIHADLIESLVWYIALVELQSDSIAKSNERKEENEKEIAILNGKIEHAQQNIKNLLQRKERLDEDYYVNLALSDERYRELCERQNESIQELNKSISDYNSKITFLNDQIESAITFDETLDSLRDKYESLRAGTDFDTMRMVICRYVKSITVEPLEGKLTNFWKVVHIELFNNEQREKLIQHYEEQNLHDAAVILGTTFYIDCRHHRAYWDKDLQYEAPITLLGRVKGQRKDTRKGRKRKPTKNKQY